MPVSIAWRIFNVAWQRMEDYRYWSLIVSATAPAPSEIAPADESEAPAPPMPTKYYAVARGKKTGIFTDVATYEKATHGYPNALARGFKSREEAEGWLKSPNTLKLSATAGKKYYAVARGKMTGIFTTLYMYKKATDGFSGVLARSFKSQKDAEEWLETIHNTVTAIKKPKVRERNAG